VPPGRADGRCSAVVGNTVDVENASYTNDIGAPILGACWKDPDFNPKQRAFYYVRVIEIPTPRWTAFDAKFYGIKMSDEVPMTLQERAYTSPIWYTPATRARRDVRFTCAGLCGVRRQRRYGCAEATRRRQPKRCRRPKRTLPPHSIRAAAPMRNATGNLELRLPIDTAEFRELCARFGPDGIHARIVEGLR